MESKKNIHDLKHTERLKCSDSSEHNERSEHSESSEPSDLNEHSEQSEAQDVSESNDPLDSFKPDEPFDNSESNAHIESQGTTPKSQLEDGPRVIDATDPLGLRVRPFHTEQFPILVDEYYNTSTPLNTPLNIPVPAAVRCNRIGKIKDSTFVLTQLADGPTMSYNNSSMDCRRTNNLNSKDSRSPSNEGDNINDVTLGNGSNTKVKSVLPDGSISRTMYENTAKVNNVDIQDVQPINCRSNKAHSNKARNNKAHSKNSHLNKAQRNYGHRNTSHSSNAYTNNTFSNNFHSNNALISNAHSNNVHSNNGHSNNGHSNNGLSNSSSSHGHSNNGHSNHGHSNNALSNASSSPAQSDVSWFSIPSVSSSSSHDNHEDIWTTLGVVS